MSFQPYVDSRSESFRRCNCGEDHDIKIVTGMFHYSVENRVGVKVAFIEHDDEHHLWISFITGEWPGTGHADCYVTAHVWTGEEGRLMRIEDSANSPFEDDEVFDCFPVTREQVLAQDGAKDWFVRTYLSLFESDDEIGSYLPAEP